uniref:Uncharacterized protein n=1 Tax=Anopheles atroparvus TaxID=41427 RepID=A0AAG5DJ24_ANOAO
PTNHGELIGNKTNAAPKPRTSETDDQTSGRTNVMKQPVITFLLEETIYQSSRASRGQTRDNAL